MPGSDDVPHHPDRRTIGSEPESREPSPEGPGSSRFSSTDRTLSRREALRLGVGALATGALVPGLLPGRAQAMDGRGAGSLRDAGGMRATGGVMDAATQAGGAPVGAPGEVLSQDLILKTIPASGEQIPAVGMGTWQTFMVDPVDEELDPLRAVLRAFHEAGGRVVDSSPMYGNAEEVTGDLAAELGLLDDFWVATKVWTEGRQEGIEQMEQSMAELRSSDGIELMQVHNLVDVQVHLETLEAWKAEGRFRYIGITNTSTQRYPQVEELLDDERLDFIQTNYSLAEREAAERLLPRAQERGIGVVVARPFAGGNLFPRVQGEALPEWAAEFDCTAWSQFFLKYIISHPAVTCAIPATSNPDHMRENMGACHGRLPDEAMRRRMEEVIDAL